MVALATATRLEPDPVAVLATADAKVGALADLIGDSLEACRAALPLHVVEARLATGDLDGIVDAVPWAVAFAQPATLVAKAPPALGDQLTSLIADLITAGARLSGVSPEHFALINAEAVRAAREHGARLVTNVRAATREAIARIIGRAVRGRYTVRDAAVLIRNIVGLTLRQANAAAAFADALAARAAAGQSSAGLASRWTLAGRLPAHPTPQQAADAAARYAARLLRHRATVIARTEVLRAANRGLTLAWEVAARTGDLGWSSQKVWVTTPDDRLCSSCSSLSGANVGLASDFAPPGGYLSGKVVAAEPPLHPQCRCTVYLEAVPPPRSAVLVG